MTQEMFNSLEGLSCVVVGGAGFLGHHMVEHLVEDRKADVTVVDNLSTGDCVREDTKFFHCDITHSEAELLKIFKKVKADVVFNYAAYPYIPVSFERPLHIFQINTVGAINVINAAQEAGAKSIVQISSAEVYGSSTGKIRECEPVQPHSTYGASKAAIDFYCQSAWQERNTPVMAIRQFNCIGEHETHPYVVPEIISQLSETPHTVRLGNNSQRDFMYAGTAVAYAAQLALQGRFGMVYNLGSEETIRIYSLANIIHDLWHKKMLEHHPQFRQGELEIIMEPERVRPWEIWSLRADTGLLRGTVNWQYVEHHWGCSLETALSKVIDDYWEFGFQWKQRQHING